MAVTGLSTFKTTSPSNGTMRFLVSGSAHAPSNAVTHSVIGVTVSVFDCNNASRLNAVANLQNFTIGSDTINVINGVPQSDNRHYYYEIFPIIETGSLATYQGVCTLTSLTPPPRIDTFKNSPFNAVFNNAIVPRRIHRTGSKGTTVESGIYGGVFEIDKSGDQIVPSNLDAIISRSAATASFQESNLYTKSWTLPRYEGSKLTSESLFYNDPALSFRSFEAAKFPIQANSLTIRSSSFDSLDVKEYFFNSPFKLIRNGLNGYHQGSTGSTPPVGQPIYELEGRNFRRVTKTKLFIPSKEEIIAIDDSLARYELKPVDPVSGSNNHNIFNLEFTTLAVDDTIYYWDVNNQIQNRYIRAGNTEELIVSGTYVAGTNSFSSDAPASMGSRVGITQGALTVEQPWQSMKGRTKTYVSKVISTSVG